MPETVVDTTPLNYLIGIDAAELLPRIYGSLWIPPAVETELRHPAAPVQVREWIQKPPSWLKIRAPREKTNPALARLGPGERQAISLALESRSSLLLVDDRDAVMTARALGLSTVGTLAVLDLAASRNWIDLPTMFQRLQQTTFRSPVRLMARLLEEDAHRKSKRE
jgi:predicted nucleic acid-binding protein